MGSSNSVSYCDKCKKHHDYRMSCSDAAKYMEHAKQFLSALPKHTTKENDNG